MSPSELALLRGLARALRRELETARDLNNNALDQVTWTRLKHERDEFREEKLELLELWERTFPSTTKPAA